MNVDVYVYTIYIVKISISDIKPEGRNDAILVWAPAWDLPDAKGIFFYFYTSYILKYKD